uniref:BLOC-1-related complex subunit 5 n=1 Tax=Petromyzon marinus TaxID=7757 RepID=A0AAJ7WP35_PETMA|nr:BLOC-1-related complex subunit 5 isoform X3 [Petromyzon marinus]
MLGQRRNLLLRLETQESHASARFPHGPWSGARHRKRLLVPSKHGLIAAELISSRGQAMGADQSTAEGGKEGSLEAASHPAQALSGARPKERATMEDIVVVAPGVQTSPRDPWSDPELLKLQEIPRFFPLLRGLGPGEAVAGGAAGVRLERMDSRRVLQLCLRYQEHLQQCAEAVAFDQNMLTQRIKERNSVTLNNTKDFAKCQRRRER